MYYDLLSPTPPPLPQKLPGMVNHIISKVPDYVKPAAAQMLFPPLAAQMHDIEFRYITNILREPVCCMEGCIANSGVGKGFIDDMIEEIIRPLRAEFPARRMRREILRAESWKTWVA